MLGRAACGGLDDFGIEDGFAAVAKGKRMKRVGLAVMGFLCVASVGAALAGAAAKPPSAKKLDALETQALAVMQQKAAALSIQGVAVVSFAPGDKVAAWTSKMAVVGRMTDPKASANGNNLLGIAYAKSAEMADTLANSGTVKRPPMTGEFGWQGGAIAEAGGGHIIVAFSGGKSEDDLQVSQAGLAVMKKGF